MLQNVVKLEGPLAEVQARERVIRLCGCEPEERERARRSKSQRAARSTEKPRALPVVLQRVRGTRR